MYKQFKHTITAAEAAGADVIIEVGFIPSRIVVKNRTSDYSLDWNSSMASDEYWQTVGSTGVDTFEDTGTATFNLIDGSDKTNNTDKSFGFYLPGNLANITDAQEVLDIFVYREDGV